MLHVSLHLVKVLGFVAVVPSVYCSQIVPFVTSIWNATVIIPYATIVTFSATSCSWWVGAGDCHVMLVGLVGREPSFVSAWRTPTTMGKRSGYTVYVAVDTSLGSTWVTLGRNFHWEDNNWSNLPASTSSKAPSKKGVFVDPIMLEGLLNGTGPSSLTAAMLGIQARRLWKVFFINSPSPPFTLKRLLRIWPELMTKIQWMVQGFNGPRHFPRIFPPLFHLLSTISWAIRLHLRRQKNWTFCDTDFDLRGIWHPKLTLSACSSYVLMSKEVSGRQEGAVARWFYNAWPFIGSLRDVERSETSQGSCKQKRCVPLQCCRSYSWWGRDSTE